MATLNLPKFRYCTSTYFGSITPDESTLYFLTDTQQIYKGATLYSGSVKFVTAVPTAANMAVGTIYVNTSNNCAYALEGSNVRRIGVVMQTAIDDASTTNDADGATIGAIKSYVSAHNSTISSAYVNAISTASSALHSQITAVAGDLTTASGALSTSIDTASGALNTSINTASGALSTSIDNASSTLNSKIDTTSSAIVQRIENIGIAVNYKGVKADMSALSAVTGMKPGDVWTVKTGETVDGVVQSNVEYIYCDADEDASVEAHWEMIGPTVDLSGYATDDDVSNVSSALNDSISAASSALNSSINTASGALNTSITNASSALNSAITAVAGDLTAASSALNTSITTASSALHSEITAVAGDLETASGALSTSISTASSALDTSITTASSALNSKIDAGNNAKLDKFAGTTGHVVLVDSDGSAVKDGSYVIGGEVLGNNSGNGDRSGATNTLATEIAVAEALSQLNWKQLP